MKVEQEVESSGLTNDSRAPHASIEKVHSLSRHAANVTLIVVAIVALFWRVFFLGETLIDVNTLNNQLPWGYYAGQSGYPYNRRDLTDTYVTREYFVVAAYRDGELPLWNPYTMAGHPIYADGVTRTLSPFLLFYKIFDVPLGYSVARITELMVAAVFMYIFLVGIGAAAGGALMGSLVFAFSAHSMLHLTGLGWWGGLMWLPLILLFVDRAIRRESYAQAMLAGVFLAIQFFCGYLPNQIYYAGAVVLYYLFFAFIERDGEGERRRLSRTLAMMVVTLAVGFTLSATQWVPSLELLSYSNRKVVGAELGYVWLPPWYAATLLFPNLFGSAYDANMLRLFTALGASHDHILYLGIAALMPLGFSLWWLRQEGQRRRKRGAETVERSAASPPRRVSFFALLAAVSLVVMMAAPLYVPVTRFVPILQVIRVAVRAGVLFLFAAAALVALGTDSLLNARVGALQQFFRLARRFGLFVAGCVLLGVVGSYVLKLTGFAVDTGARGRIAFLRRSALALSAQFTPPSASILISLAFLSVGLSLVWALGKARISCSRFLGCLVALLIIDLLWNSAQFDRSFDRSHVFPETEITNLLRSLPPGRVLVVPSNLETNRAVSAEPGAEKIIAPPNTLLPYQIPSVTGKNQQFPKWYREYASLIEPQPNLSHVVFDQHSSQYFDLLNVRYVLTHTSAPPLDGCELLASAEGISVYESKSAMPRAFFAPDVVEVQTAAESLDVLRDSSFNPRTTAIIETGRSLTHEPRLDPTTPAPGSAAIIEDERNRVVIDAENERAGLLVLSDNYYPGWRAYVDGSPVEVFRANHTMRAVRVPAGRHVVSFVFVPATFFVSLYVGAAAAGFMLVALAFSFMRRKRV